MDLSRRIWCLWYRGFLADFSKAVGKQVSHKCLLNLLAVLLLHGAVLVLG